jgi:hypothetical protein
VITGIRCALAKDSMLATKVLVMADIRLEEANG